MPPDSNSNAPASAKTSATPGRPSDKPPTKPLTEAELLTRQAQDAKAAVARTARELQHDLLRTADPRAWMLVHPWATLSAALVAGFASANAAIPSKEEKALKRLSALEAALNAEKKPDPQNGHADGKIRDKTSSSLSKVTALLLKLAQPILVSGLSALTSQLTNQQSPATPPTSPPGNPPQSPQDPAI